MIPMLLLAYLLRNRLRFEKHPCMLQKPTAYGEQKKNNIKEYLNANKNELKP